MAGITPPQAYSAKLRSSAYADVTASNTTSETTLASFAIPTTAKAGDLVVLTAFGDLLNNSGGSATYRFRGYIGATAVLDSSTTISISTNAARRTWTSRMEFLVAATNAQRAHGTLFTSAANGVSFNLFSSGAVGGGVTAATEDLTAGKNAVLTITLGTAAATIDCVMHGAHLVHFPS